MRAEPRPRRRPRRRQGGLHVEAVQAGFAAAAREPDAEPGRLHGREVGDQVLVRGPGRAAAPDARDGDRGTAVGGRHPQPDLPVLPLGRVDQGSTVRRPGGPVHDVHRRQRARGASLRRDQPQTPATATARNEGHPAPVGRDRGKRVDLGIRGEGTRVSAVGVARPDVVRSAPGGAERDPPGPGGRGSVVLGPRARQRVAETRRRRAQVQDTERPDARAGLADEAPPVPRDSRREVVPGPAGEAPLAPAPQRAPPQVEGAPRLVARVDEGLPVRRQQRIPRHTLGRNHPLGGAAAARHAPDLGGRVVVGHEPAVEIDPGPSCDQAGSWKWSPGREGRARAPRFRPSGPPGSRRRSPGPAACRRSGSRRPTTAGRRPGRGAFAADRRGAPG